MLLKGTIMLIKKYSTYYFLIIFMVSISLCFAQDTNIRIIQFNKIGQEETIRKGEDYRIIYGVANPENTRIRYKQSKNDDEYILELVYYQDLVRASEEEKEDTGITTEEYQRIKEQNDSLQSLLDSKLKEIEDNKEKEQSKEEQSQETVTEGHQKDSASNAIVEQKETDISSNEIEEYDNKISKNRSEYESNQKRIEELQDKINEASDQGSPERIIELHKELNDLMKRNNALLEENNNLTKDKNLLMKDIELKEVALEKQIQQRNFLIIIAALILLISIVIYISYKAKKKANKQLQSLNEELEEKNYKITQAHNQITDSINYALKIQKAVLPKEDKLNELLQEHFVLFKPKSVVSGDFYWAEKIDGRLFIAVIDCTGHGVPGAFMSIIGNDLLNQIIKERKIHTPSKILKELHEGVRAALQQKDVIGEASDGMDMCLIMIQKNTLTFAGAKRPLWYIKNNKFHEIKGNRKPIGGRQKEKVRRFDDHDVLIDADMIIYLTSDGYSDQNDPDNKSYTTRRLKNFLDRINKNPMSKQYDLLIKELENHADGEPNRDDITILGFKLTQRGANEKI